MARSDQRSSREKKSKADKAKPAAQTSPFERGPNKGDPKRTVKKKGR
jgi:hypothetical protein